MLNLDIIQIVVSTLLLKIHANCNPASLQVNMSGEQAGEGAQWLSGRVLDSRPKGRGFEPHRRHCVVVLEQDTFILA